MNHRSVRLALFVMVLLAVGAAAYYFLAATGAAAAAREEERSFSSRASALVVRISDMRAAQQAYVAAGQGETFWAREVTSLLEGIKQDLNLLRASARVAAAQGSIDLANEQVGVFEQMDTRARDYVQRRQQLMASDLIFTDGLEITRSIVGFVDSARTEEQLERTRAAADASRKGLGALAGSSVFALLVLLTLASTGAEQKVSGEPAPIELQPQIEPVIEQPLEKAAVAVPEVRGIEVPPLPSAVADGASAQMLRSAADLCTDLGRVMNPSELPSLLERAAKLLDAAGIILWMADSPPDRLRPVVAHGYGSQALARIKPIMPDADNATASAFRLARLEIVRTNGAVNGAIVAPLITPTGCVGVMAAELKNGAECKTALHAMAIIIAAQLAALVTVPGQATGQLARSELSRTS